MPDNLYVAWQDQATRRWHTVARLRRTEFGYEFVFTRGVGSLRTIPSDLFRMDVMKEYRSERLFPIFKNRLPSRGRNDFNKMAKWLNLKGAENEFESLSKFGLIPGIDSLLVYPEPDIISATYRLEFFIHGLRHMNPESIALCSGLAPTDRLLPLLDVQNSLDANAVAIRLVAPPMLIGYVPGFYAPDFRALLERPGIAANAQLSVIRSNEDAPYQLRLLCKFECPVPDGFRALNTDAHQPLLEQAA